MKTTKMSLMKERRRTFIEDMLREENSEAIKDMRIKLQMPKDTDRKFQDILDDIITTSREQQKKLKNEFK